MTQPVEKAAAIVTIFNGANMTLRGRKEIAKWLRGRADLLEAEADNLAPRFTSRYLYRESQHKKAKTNEAAKGQAVASPA